MRILGSGNIGIGTVAPATLLTVVGPISLNKPSTQTASYTQLVTDSSLVFNSSSTITLTMLGAATYPGQILLVRNINTGAVVSSAANVVPQAGGAAATAILPAATAGAWAELQSDGANWDIMASSSGGGSSTLNGITAATGNQAGISNGNNTIAWNWALTTASEDAFTFGESVAASVTAPTLVQIKTLSTSTTIPLTITNAGASLIGENITAGGLAIGGVNVLALPYNDTTSIAVGEGALVSQSTGSLGTHCRW